MAPATAEPGTLVDGHVHFYAVHSPAAVLTAAVRNLRHAARASREAASPDGSRPGGGARAAVLVCLAEDHRHDAFRSLRTGSWEPEGWVLEPTAEEESWHARIPGEDVVTVCSGFQVGTREGLELLALCTRERPAEGRELAESVREVADSGGIPVLPWAFGKWWFARGRCLERFLDGSARPPIFLGDNGGRAAGLPGPGPYELAARYGLQVLPGSDPLPLRGGEAAAGRAGFRLAGRVDADRPAAWLREAVRKAGSEPIPIGRTCPWPRFLRDQLALRIGAAR